MSELFKSILEAKRNITPPQKNRKAMYGRYADLEAILTAVEPALAEQGLVIVQTVTHSEGSNYLRTSVVHVESGESISSDVPLVSKDDRDPQKLGGSITYARRYGITALLSIVADDDDDGNTSAGKNKDGTSVKKTGGPGKAVDQGKIEEVMKGGSLPDRLVDALVNEFTRAGFDNSDIVPEVKAVLKRDFGQLSELTEAEARTAVGHARKVKGGDAKRVT